jgi:hypothetical protein
MSKTRRLTLQEQLDRLHALVLVPVAVPVDVLRWDNAEAMRRVAAAGMVLVAAASLEKQETPEVGAPEVSTDRSPLRQDHDGRYAKSA